MPKLTAKDRKKVKKAEAVGGGFEPIAPGKYVANLSGVEAKDSSTGNPMWVLEFDEIHDLDGDKVPGRQWLNLMLPQDTMPEDYEPKNSKKSPEEAWEAYQNMCEGRLKQFFEVFGFEEDSDTDEMIGERCIIQIGVRTIQRGARAGEKANQVNGMEAYDPEKHGDIGEDGKDPDNF